MGLGSLDSWKNGIGAYGKAKSACYTISALPIPQVLVAFASGAHFDSADVCVKNSKHPGWWQLLEHQACEAQKNSGHWLGKACRRRSLVPYRSRAWETRKSKTYSSSSLLPHIQMITNWSRHTGSTDPLSDRHWKVCLFLNSWDRTLTKVSSHVTPHKKVLLHAWKVIERRLLLQHWGRRSTVQVVIQTKWLGNWEKKTVLLITSV